MADIELTPQQLEQFKEALKSAFLPGTSSLAQVVQTGLGENLSAIVSLGNYDDQVFSLVTWARAQGRLRDLLDAARAKNPGSPDLQQFAKTVQQSSPDGDLTGFLPPSVYQRCLAALSKCGEFADDVTLHEVIDEQRLAVLLTQQPSLATSPEQRAAEVLDQLLPGYLADGRLALAALLHVLSQRTPNESLSQELGRLETEVTDALGSLNPLTVSFVVAAMTESEAGTILAGTSLPPGLQSFLGALKPEDKGKLASCYRTERDTWSPPGHPAVAIRDVVVNTVNLFNQKQGGEARKLLIRPIFESARFFDLDNSVWFKTKAYLEKPESVVVIIADAVSLFHEHLHERLQYAAIWSLVQTPVLIFSPTSLIFSPDSDPYVQTRLLIQEAIAQRCLNAFIRFDAQLDRCCEVGIDDLRGLRRWLYGVLPDAVQRAQPGRLRPENCAVFEGRKRRGYGGVIYGSGQSRLAGR